MYSCLTAELLEEERSKLKELREKLGQVKYENYIKEQTKDLEPQDLIRIGDIHYQMRELKRKMLKEKLEGGKDDAR